MKMSIGEKKILFVFGCPNREATMDRLYQVADLIPDPAGKKVVEALADKLDSEGVEKWYRCFFYNMKLEMEAYYRHKAILNRIVGGSMEVDNDEIDEDSERTHHPVQRGTKHCPHLHLQCRAEKTAGSVQQKVS